MAVKRTLRCERDQIIGGWIKLLMRSFITCTPCKVLLEVSSQGRLGKQGGSMHGRDCVQGFVRKPEGKRPLGRYRHREEDVLKSVLKIRCEGGGLIHLVWDRDR
jgi:hypothetical protein